MLNLPRAPIVLVLALALGLISAASWAQDTNRCSMNREQLRYHMCEASYDFDDLKVKVNEIFSDQNNEAKWAAAALSASRVRAQMIAAIAFVPAKVATLRGSERALSLADFHQQVARVVYKLADLERRLIIRDFQPESGSRQRDIVNLLNEIDVIVGRGHGKYR